MRHYSVYNHPVHGLKAVKNGFSWPAFFFCVIWMLYKRLWIYALIWFVLIVVIQSVMALAADNLYKEESNITLIFILYIINLVLWLVPAFKGNSWYEQNLARRGFYIIKRALPVRTADEAIAQVFNLENQSAEDKYE